MYNMWLIVVCNIYNKINTAYTPDLYRVDNRHPTILLSNAHAQGLKILFVIKFVHGWAHNRHPVSSLCT